MIVTVVDRFTGKELRAQFTGDRLAENEIEIEELRTEQMNNPYFNFETRQFYEKV